MLKLLDGLDDQTAHDLVKDLVIPRPIAWITTLRPNGVVNIAPYSFYTIVAYKPALVVVGFERVGISGEEKKDTLKNIERTSEFVINSVTEPLMDKMNRSAVTAPIDESKVEAAGLTTLPSVKVQVPRIAESPISMECRAVNVQNVAARTDLLIGEIQVVHIHDDVLDDKQQMDFGRLHAIARMGGDYYVRLREFLHAPRPWLDGVRLR